MKGERDRLCKVTPVIYTGWYSQMTLHGVVSPETGESSEDGDYPVSEGLGGQRAPRTRRIAWKPLSVGWFGSEKLSCRTQSRSNFCTLQNDFCLQNLRTVSSIVRLCRGLFETGFCSFTQSQEVLLDPPNAGHKKRFA